MYYQDQQVMLSRYPIVQELVAASSHYYFTLGDFGLVIKTTSRSKMSCQVEHIYDQLTVDSKESPVVLQKFYEYVVEK